MKKARVYFIACCLWPAIVLAGGLAAPTGLDDIDATDRNISLQWNASSGATAYHLYQVFDKGEDFLATVTHATDYVVTQVKPFHNSSSMVSLSPFTSYRFTVRAWNGSIESADSNIVTAKTTHTWTGVLLDCLNSGDHIPTRTELENVSMLYCSEKNLTRSDIEPVQDLVHVDTLHLERNSITGELPEWIYGTLTLLQYLHLEQNNLTGNLPPEIQNLANLRELLLSENNLSGEIPEEIGNLHMLVRLYLSNNHLSGSIPATISALSYLQYLLLANNKLSGRIPSSLQTMTSLTDGWGLTLFNNCNLWNNDATVQDFINQKSSYYSGSSTPYQYILDTNSHDCFMPAIVPVINYELQ